MLNADVGTDSTNVACSSTLLILELLIPITAMIAITAIAIPAGIAIFFSICNTASWESFCS